jgi:F-type H+-transporting ATPase subunit delta
MVTTKRSRRMARQLFQLCLVAGRLDADRVRQVARRLGTASDREALALLSEFHRLVRLDRTRHSAIVESASPLGDDVRQDVTAQLTERHGDDLEVTFAINPALIGGMRVKVGSHIYDGSVRGRLDALERQL